MELSTSELAMVASNSFESILKKIRTSNLNFNMQLTPFSAVISLRKSFVKDKFRSTPFPHAVEEDQTEAVKSKLEKDLRTLEKEHEKTALEYAKAVDMVKHLEIELQKRNDTISTLEAACKTARESAVILNNMVNENRVKFESEKIAIFKEHKTEVKIWRKDLGEAIRKHKNLERKFKTLEDKQEDHFIHAVKLEPTAQKDLDKSQVSCSYCIEEHCTICSRPIENYIPDYFCGERINPACYECKKDDDLCDPFSSFPSSDIPPSLVAHWNFNPKNIGAGIGCICSLRGHYVSIPNPGDSYVSAEEVLLEFKAFLEEQRREYRESCKQS